MARKKTSKRMINGNEYYYKKVTVGVDPLTKKIIRRDFYGLTITELNEKIDKYLLESNKSLSTNSNDTVGKLLEYWLVNAKFKQGINASTIERYWGIYQNYILNIEYFLKLPAVDKKLLKKLLIKDIPLTNLKVTHIQEYYNTLHTLGVTSNTITFINKIIKPFISYAYVSDKIKKDFTKILFIPKDSKDSTEYGSDYKESINFFSDNELKLFFKAIEGNREEVLYKTAISTGLRLGELLGLKWSCIDLDNGTLQVKLSARRIKDIYTGESILKLTSLKTSSSYATLPIPLRLIPYLKKHKAEQDKEKSIASNLYEDNDLVFCTELGKITEPSNLRKRYKKILLKNNISDKPFHALRHTCASILFAMGKDIVEVKDLMRHKNISTTVDIYMHFTKEYKKNLVNDFPI